MNMPEEKSIEIILLLEGFGMKEKKMVQILYLLCRNT